MSSHFGADLQGSQISIAMFSHYGANSQGLQISIGTNANS
jgi:hypothetical protein